VRLQLGPSFLIEYFALQHCAGYIVQYWNRLPAGLDVSSPVWCQRWLVYSQMCHSVSDAVAEVLLPDRSEFLAEERLEGIAAHFGPG